MGEAIGQVLPFAVGVTLSPVPIIGVVLMLGTPRARSNGPAFVLGWIIGLTIVGELVLLASSGAGASADAGPADWVSVLKLILGLLLLLLAVKQWRGRDEAQGTPKWMKSIEHFKPPKAAGLGVLLSAANPKNLILTIGAAAAIAETGIGTGEQEVSLAVFILLGTIGPAVPVALYSALGARSERILASLEEWMSRNNAAIMSVLFLVIGAKLIGDAISGLA